MSDERAFVEEVKLAALADGLRIDPPLLAALGGPRSLTVHEYATTGGITLVVAGDVYMNAPFDEPFCADSRVLLRGTPRAPELVLQDRALPVDRIVPLPGFIGARDSAGTLVDETTMSHADRIRVSPIDGCAYDCRFCDLASTRYRPHPVEQILRGIDVARADRALPPRHLLISGGSPAKGQAQQDAFEEVCRRIVRHVRSDGPLAPLEVDIMMSARPDGPAFVDRMVAAGVAGFSLNVEVFSMPQAERFLPLKQRFARPHLRAMLERAVERLGWGSGRVRSLIIPGLEPVEETLAGVEWLAALGCSPVISPFRPARGTLLARQPPVSADVLRQVLDRARDIVARHGVCLGPRCVPCQHNTVAFPWDLAQSP